MIPLEAIELILHQNMTQYLALGARAEQLSYEQVRHNCTIVVSILRTVISDLNKLIEYDMKSRREMTPSVEMSDDKKMLYM